MDNLCHSLVGAALGQAGLKRRSGLGMATLVIGANFPDVDGIAMLTEHALAFRRGWTHGVPALLVLPFVLTGLMLAWDRVVRRRGGRVPEHPVVPGQLLLLAFLAIWTHPLLDYMNNYGMRWLMPLSGRWSYGDALFIVDPWMWVALALGVALGRRRGGGGRRVALASLAAVTLYTGAMYGSAAWGRWAATRQLEALGWSPRRVMVAAVPVNPFRRQVVVEQADRYGFGTLTFLPRPRLVIAEHELPKNDLDPAALAAAATPEGRRFLVWSRFPFYVVEQDPAGARVRIDDARYSAGTIPSWASTTVVVHGMIAADAAGRNPTGTGAAEAP
jgi:inner membrane protein